MKKFKYKIFKLQSEITESKLNELGKRGMELVNAVYDKYFYIYHFKIEIDEKKGGDEQK